MGNSVQPSNDCADDVSSIPISDWQLISDQSVDPQFPQRFESGPRQPPSLTISQRPAPTVSHPGMIQSLPMVSQAKCKPAMPPVFSASSQPCSLQFTSRAMTTCKPNPLVYTHHPPAPGEKRLKTQHDRSGTTAVTSLVRTKTPSNIPFLVNLWVSILTALGTLSNFNQMASIILDSFAASTLHRYLSCISKFFAWCRDMDILLASISVSTVLDVLQGGSKNSGMKGSTILKSLQWCRKQADVANWAFLDSPLIQSWSRSKTPTDRRESLPLPLYVVCQWERRVLQANIPTHELLILGGFLMMIWSGLRYSDLQRVTIKSIVCSPTEIRGISWRTKTCSKGQPWGARASGFLSVGTATWLSRFVQEWDRVLASQNCDDMDFVIPHFQSDVLVQPFQPMSYPTALYWFRLFLTIPWKRNSATASVDTASYSIHGMKATLLSWASQLCHQGIITEEMRRLQGHHKPIQHSVSLYSRDDVNGQLELQRRIIHQIVTGWRPITPQHRGAQMPASEPMVSLERYRKQLGEIQLSILHWTDTCPKQVASQVDESSDSDSSDTSSDSDSSESTAPPEPKTQPNSGHLLAIGIHRFVHHALIARADKSTDICHWNDVPVQTACGKRSSLLGLHYVQFSNPQRGLVACTVGASTGLKQTANSGRK